MNVSRWLLVLFLILAPAPAEARKVLFFDLWKLDYWDKTRRQMNYLVGQLLTALIQLLIAKAVPGLSPHDGMEQAHVVHRDLGSLLKVYDKRKKAGKI